MWTRLRRNEFCSLTEGMVLEMWAEICAEKCRLVLLSPRYPRPHLVVESDQLDDAIRSLVAASLERFRDEPRIRRGLSSLVLMVREWSAEVLNRQANPSK